MLDLFLFFLKIPTEFVVYFFLGILVGSIGMHMFNKSFSVPPIDIPFQISADLIDHLIPIMDASQMVTEFDSNTDEATTKYGEIPFSVLENYVEYLQYLVERYNGSINHIRVYFAKYPEEFDSERPMTTEGESPYRNKLGLFIVPIGTDTNGLTGPLAYNRNSDEFLLLDSNVNYMSSHSSTTLVPKNLDSLCLNEFNLTPPPN